MEKIIRARYVGIAQKYVLFFFLGKQKIQLFSIFEQIFFKT
jgi:hypothetical protein